MIQVWVHRVAAERNILKIKDLAELANLNSITISKLWNNKSSRVDFPTLDALCKALDCQIGDLIKYVPDEPAKKKRS